MTKKNELTKVLKDSSVKPPKAIKKASLFKNHNDKRVDNYFWMNNIKDPDTLKYIEAENKYTEQKMKPLEKLTQKLFKEMKSKIKENDSSAPASFGEYNYYTKFKKGKQYAIHCRKKKKGGKEEILLDQNTLAKGKKYFSVGTFKISPDHNWLAYAIDVTGDEIYTTYFKNLKTGKLLKGSVGQCSGSFVWANDNSTFFYSELNENHRPFQVRRGQKEDLSKTEIVFTEKESLYFVYVSKTSDDAYILVESAGKVTSETWFVSADEPRVALTCVQKKIEGHDYSVDHRQGLFYIRSNDKAANFKIMVTPVHQHEMKYWQEWIPEDKSYLIQDTLVFDDHIILSEYGNAVPRLRAYSFSKEKFSEIKFKEKTFAISVGQGNLEYKTHILRVVFESLSTPTTVLDIDLRNGKRKIVKQDKVKGYKSSNYKSDLIWVPSHDGKKIPMSVFYKKTFKKNGRQPFLLYGYGSYGAVISARFNRNILSLLDRGFGFAIAHIRGGQEMGRAWYEDGKYLKKKNTFLDFISCSEFLVKNKWTNPQKLSIKGGSAGGMLMGAVINMRPDLYKAVVAHVPFVDVINTMFDDKLPLTVTEYKEWGNPNDKEYYNYIKSYSPYDNVKPQSYPHLYITGGLHDHRVTYWEPTKWTALLRELKTDQNDLLLKIKTSAGHFGASGRFDWLKEEAETNAFLIKYLDEPLK